MTQSGTRKRRTALAILVVAAIAGIAVLPRATAFQGPESAELVYTRFASPEAFSYSELVRLSRGLEAEPELEERLSVLRTVPFVNNEAFYRQAEPARPEVAGVAGLRVVMWNIERGTHLDRIIQAISDPRSLLDAGLPDADRHRLAEELEILQTADVFVLNEADWGLARSGYVNVAAELAEALGMNWAYGVEFVEVDPVVTGRDDSSGGAGETLPESGDVDPGRLRALHGTAVLSRYPIVDARLVPFDTTGYDWNHAERNGMSPLEGGRRLAASVAFQARIAPREIRRGGRTALLVDLDVADLPEGRLTIAATHLEGRAKPEIRRAQMEELLAQIRDIRHPVILAGDMNTSVRDESPISLRQQVLGRLGSTVFWTGVGIKYLTGVGLLYDLASNAANYLKNHDDPTARHIPFVAPNPEKELFEMLEDFRFDDGYAFDFRGDRERTINGTSGTLANSNQRDNVGFAVTFQFDRPIGPIGKFKLDWIFVKSYLDRPRDSTATYRFAPHFSRTLSMVNLGLEEPLSDHHPISIDLPFDEPRLQVKAD